ncbi:MAG: PVC-type heme-binding CxxCH protein [Pirellula sp.]
MPSVSPLRPFTRRSRVSVLAALTLCAANSGSLLAQSSDTKRPTPEVPTLAAASGDAQSAISSFKKPAGWKTELFAAEPMVGNPVAFTIDGQGRVYVCESYRQGVGVTDNRSHDETWLQADLQAMTVQDRIDYHKRLLGNKVADYESKDDLIRLLVDRDGDFVADTASVFASGFNGLEEGTGAGALVRDGKVFYTNIPHLWWLVDKDGDGVADEKTSVARGFGVRVAFRGHDMHGLVNGPDGRIYFSIGDRGYHVETPNGVFADPESGAVFRVEPDGSRLELFAVGLRNPQELAFDDYGNLFTGDNNSDSGDRARWVHVVRGGDSGWRMMYQYIPDRGPFNRERVWYPYDENSPAYIVPPIMNLSDGPSGLVCYPGTGLDDSFRNSFFLVDFRGQASNSGIRRIRMEPNGAGFKVVTNEEFIWNILATDAEFGPDGGLYVADWVNGWNGENKGRIYRFSNPETVDAWMVKETRTMLASGVSDRNADELEHLLAHPDRRIRQLAQWELAKRGANDVLVRVATKSDAGTLARLHGIWGVGQTLRQLPLRTGYIAEKDVVPEAPVLALAGLVNDSDEQIAARALDTLGDSLRYRSLEAKLRDTVVAAVRHGLESESAVVTAAACLAVERLKLDALLPQVLKVIEANADRDPVLRHSTIMALTGIKDVSKVAGLSQNANASVRLAAVVALRKLKHAGIGNFVADESLAVSREAIRGIHDVPELHSLLPLLADRIVGVPNDDAVVRRVLNANFRLGQSVHAARLASFAANANADPKARIEALEMLGKWGEPGLNDRVLNRYLPLEKRDPEPAVTALKSNLEALAAAPEAVRDRFLEVGARYDIKGIDELVAASYRDTKNTPARRAAALVALANIAPDQVRGLLESALKDPAAEIRVAALKTASKLDPDRALSAVTIGLRSQVPIERQAAWDVLAQLPESKARGELVTTAYDDYIAKRIPADARLNAFEALEQALPEAKRNAWKAYVMQLEASRSEQPVQYYADSMEGGDVAAGKLLFFTKASLSCVRCHKVGVTGGEVGPNLSEIGTKKMHEYLLEAIVAPNANIAEGFKTIIVQDEDGGIYSGILKSEDQENVVLLDAQGALQTIPADTITGRREGLSSMPIDLVKYLSRRELRDLVAYLKSLDGTPAATSGVFESTGGHGL